MRKSSLAILVATSLSTTVWSGSAFAESDAMSVFGSHIQGFTTGDLDLMLSNITEDTVVIAPGELFIGPEDIGAFWSKQMQEFGRDGVEFQRAKRRLSAISSISAGAR